MNILFIHQNFPGQFRHLAAHLARQPGIHVCAIGREQAPGLAGIRPHRYRPHRRAGQNTHPYARTFEEGVLHGQQVLRLLLDLQRQEGYRTSSSPTPAGAKPSISSRLSPTPC